MEVKLFVALKLLAAVTFLSVWMADGSQQCIETAGKFTVTAAKNNNGFWETKVGTLGKDYEENGECVGLPTGEQKIQIQVVAHAIGTQRHVPPDYHYYPNIGYYKFHMATKTWDEARRTCRDEGAHLAIINSETEAKVLQEMFAKYRTIKGAEDNNYAFIGFHDRFVKGEYLTVLGTALRQTGFYRWADANQPDNAHDREHCGSVHRNGGLNDIPCPYKQPYFCELDICEKPF